GAASPPEPRATGRRGGGGSRRRRRQSVPLEKRPLRPWPNRPGREGFCSARRSPLNGIGRSKAGIAGRILVESASALFRAEIVGFPFPVQLQSFFGIYRFAAHRV